MQSKLTNDAETERLARYRVQVLRKLRVSKAKLITAIVEGRQTGIERNCAAINSRAKYLLAPYGLDAPNVPLQ